MADRRSPARAARGPRLARAGAAGWFDRPDVDALRPIPSPPRTATLGLGPGSAIDDWVASFAEGVGPPFDGVGSSPRAVVLHVVAPHPVVACGGAPAERPTVRSGP